ncbi:MAG TPA: histidine phosphatase family protein [Kiritimatiellia bacterium]|nr:histidine phosphatase family protein [Kiritimatiellia bacterium]
MMAGNGNGGRVLWLIRHGMREDFVDAGWRERASRPHDPPLAAQGVQQARETAAFLAKEGVEVIYTSPFLRTVQTAGELAKRLGCAIRVEHGLTETLKSAWFPDRPTYVDPVVLVKEYPGIDLRYVPKVEPDYPEEDEDADTGPRCLRMVREVEKDAWGCAVLISHGAAVGQTAKALLGGSADGICCAMCGVNRFEQGADGVWRLTLAGTDHLSWSEHAMRFH